MNTQPAPRPAPDTEFHQEFRDYLARKGLKSTRQRDLIVDVFSKTGDEHVSVEDLLRLVNKADPGVGYATVYRTLKLLVDAGLASVRHFGDGHARFELREHEHHDHMVCRGCGLIIEFHDDALEGMQEKVAAEYGFKVLSHKHELYGLCESCQDKQD